MRLKDCESSVKIYLPQNEQGRELLLFVRQELQRLKAGYRKQPWTAGAGTCQRAGGRLGQQLEAVF
jgi:hypothetical protein